MTITQMIKERKMVSEVENVKRFSNVNIQFLTNSGEVDETQLTAEHLLTDAGNKNLQETFRSLCEELDTKNNAVLALTIVQSADTMNKLIEEE